MPSVSPCEASRSPSIISPMLPAALLSRLSTLARLSAFSPMALLLSIISRICSRNDAELRSESFMLSPMARLISPMASFSGCVMWPMLSAFCAFSLSAFISSICLATLVICSLAVLSCSANRRSCMSAVSAACFLSSSISRDCASAFAPSVRHSASASASLAVHLPCCSLVILSSVASFSASTLSRPLSFLAAARLRAMAHVATPAPMTAPTRI